MYHKRSISDLLVPKGQGQAVALWKISALVIGLSALVLVTLAAPSGVAAADIAFSASDARLAGTHCSDVIAETGLDGNYGTLSICSAGYLAANPELMVAHRYIDSAEQGLGAAFLAANPELMTARRYIGSVEHGTEATFLAANPELMTARRYIGSVEHGTEAAFLAANPELMIARRWR